MVLLIALPIMAQNVVANLVGLLDNIMVGQLGTEQMSGVAIVNQLMMVFNICVFGLVSGASIFSAQFYGQGNHDGVRYTFRFKVISGVVLNIIWLLIFGIFGENLIALYLKDDGTSDLMLTQSSGMSYLHIMMIGLVLFTISQIYASTLREIGQTMVPMVSGIIAVFINLILNYILIFGHFGAPKMGIEGAAWATIVSRVAEALIVIIWTHSHGKEYHFIRGAYRSMKIPLSLVGQIAKKGTPLLINEALWAVGQATLVQCYSTRGLNVVAAINISGTVANLFNVVFISLGSAIGIIVGQLLGAGKTEEAVDTDRKIIFFAEICCLGIGTLMFFVAPQFTHLYNTTDEVRTLAGNLIRISSVLMPIHSFYHASYFTLRTGGKTVITFLFDSFYLTVVNVPLAFCLSRFTALPVLVLYILVNGAELFKVIVGYVLIKKRVWVNNLVSEL